MSVERWKALHAEDREVAARGGVDLLFVGDSITEGWAEHALWHEAFGRFRPANFGVGGDTTGNLLWRLDDLPAGRLEPKAVVLLIGTNNFGLAGDGPEEVFRGVAAVVGKLRDRFPGARILLLGIFPVDADPQSERRRQVAAANARIASLHDGETVVYRDIGETFLEPDGTLSPRVMPDFLHLSEEGYRRWAEAILPTLEGWLGELMGVPQAAADELSPRGEPPAGSGDLHPGAGGEDRGVGSRGAAGETCRAGPALSATGP